MNLQRTVALLGMKEGCLGMEDLGEVETAVVLLSQPTCRLEATCPSSVIISWGLEPVCSAFLQPIQARGADWAGRSNLYLEEACGFEGRAEHRRVTIRCLPPPEFSECRVISAH